MPKFLVTGATRASKAHDEWRFLMLFLALRSSLLPRASAFFTPIIMAVALLTPTLSHAHFDGYRPGETVWTASGAEGQIQAVFPNGQLSVKIGYGNYTMDRADLAVRGCYRGLCSNQSVITSSGSSGTINGVFPDGDFSVKIGYGNYKMPFEQLANASPNPPYYPYPPVPGYDLQVGQRVWTNSGSEGKVAGLFPDGDVSVSIGYANYRMSRSQLAIEGCLGNLCSGNAVVTSSGSKGTVNGFFPDNRTASVKIGYGNYSLEYSQLARTWP